MTFASMRHLAVGSFATIMLAAATSAGAAVYRGTFDPVEFMGVAEFDVPDSCVLADGWISTASCGQVDLLSAMATNEPAPPVTDELDFAPPTISDAVFGLWWQGGILRGVDSSFVYGPAYPSTGQFFDASQGYGLEFLSGHAPQQDTTAPSVNLWTCARFADFQTESVSVASVGSCYAETVVGTASQDPFVRIPEPASVALLLAGGVAGWAARRRVARR